MKTIVITTYVLLFCGCKLKSGQPNFTDCSNLQVDRRSRPSERFIAFRDAVSHSGFMFPERDSTMYPFIKKEFIPPSPTYFRDSLNINDCSIFDNINVNYFQLISNRQSLDSNELSKKQSFPDLRLEEEIFKDIPSCEIYEEALAKLFEEKRCIVRPTLMHQNKNALYIFQGHDSSQVRELVSLSMLLDPKQEGWKRNY